MTKEEIKVGAKILDTYLGHSAVITEITSNGFKYTYDRPIFAGGRFGVIYDGEVYDLGLPSWKVISEK